MLNAKTSPEDEMRQAFQVFDTDKSGSIDKNELRQVLKQLGWQGNLSATELVDLYSSRTWAAICFSFLLVGDEDLLSEMMKIADTNGDGEIDYDEFVKMMKETL